MFKFIKKKKILLNSVFSLVFVVASLFTYNIFQSVSDKSIKVIGEAKAATYTPSQVLAAVQPYMILVYAINPTAPMRSSSGPFYIYKLPTNPAVYVFTSSGAVDCDGQTTALCNSTTDDGYYPASSFTQSDGNYLIASELPWYVLPVPPNPYFDYSKSNISGGEAGLVIYNNKMNFGVFGDERGRDSGNSDGKSLGEFSYAMCISLGLSATDCNPTTGGVASGVTYLVFTTPANVVNPIESIPAAQTTGNNALNTMMSQLGITATPTPTPTPTYIPNPADANKDGVINILDLNLVSQHFGETTSIPYPRYDTNSDGMINILDIRRVAKNI